ncbi:MAG TPA: CpsB/CapC family capsule biosynthesis tyrosine phosphatase [Gemmatimonadales bacterium]|nr:CpsB/CapC family capsule biosynthesis tyrosine phosphatase [Gemmatimonadales bacterium]
MPTPPPLASTPPLHPHFTDLHSHLVPGVDDGAATMAEALESLRLLASEGVGVVVTTPHLLLPRLDTMAAVRRELDRHRRAFDELVAAAEAEEGLPELGLGQEIWAPGAPLIRPVLEHDGVGLAGTRYLLVEFGFDLSGTHADVIDEVLEADQRIVIAHPERYHFPAGLDPLETIAGWRDQGALLQINAGSLTGHYCNSSPGSERLAWRLIETGLADLIASDHHGSRRHGVSVRAAYEALAAADREAQAQILLGATPGRLLDGTAVTAS